MYSVLTERRNIKLTLFALQPLRYLNLLLDNTPISLEEHLYCIYAQGSMKVNVFIEKTMYAIQNYVNIFEENSLFSGKFSFLSEVLFWMLIGYSLTFGKLYAGVAYKRLAYKKVCKF